MTEYFACSNRSQCANTQASKKIDRISGCYVQHDNICDKEDQRRTKVCGCHQYQHMNRCHNGGNQNAFELLYIVKHTCAEKYKDNLDKFRWLYCNSCNGKGKLCTISGCTKSKYCSKSANTNHCINPGEFSQHFQFTN